MHSPAATHKVASNINKKHFAAQDHYLDPNSKLYKNLFKNWPVYKPVESLTNGRDCVTYEDALQRQIKKSETDKFYFCKK